jgi:transposase
MARPYSVDLRERVVRAVENGASRRASAAKFEVSISFVVKLLQRWRRRGTVQPDRIGGAKRSALAAHGERVHALVAAEPDLTRFVKRSRRDWASAKVFYLWMPDHASFYRDGRLARDPGPRCGRRPGAARDTAAIDRSCPAGVLPSVQDGSGVR